MAIQIKSIERPQQRIKGGGNKVKNFVKKHNGKAKVVSLAALMALFASCEKECKLGYEKQGDDCVEIVDPKAQRIAKLEQEIAALQKDSINTINKGRAALEEGLTNDKNLRPFMFEVMDANPDISRETFADTGVYVRDTGYPFVCADYAKLNKPAPNPETMGIYFDILGTYFDICGNIKTKRDEQNLLRNK